MLGCTQIIATAALICFCVLYYRKRCCKSPLFTNWPLVGMLPSFFCNSWQFHDFVSRALQKQLGTGNFIGPWFIRFNYMFTCDPKNVHHVMSKNFENYVKGPEFREIFEAFGDGIVTLDSDAWRYWRALAHSLFKNTNLDKFMRKVVRKKLQSCLIPLLDHVESQEVEVDLQEVFTRFNFDNICSLVLGFDPNSLAVDFPKVACERAFSEVEEFIMYRLIVPRCFWKLQKWLGVGAEKKMVEACRIFDQFLYEIIASRSEELSKNNEEEEVEAEADLLTAFIKKGHVDDKFLRDGAFNLFAAGRDTITSGLTWFLWLVATHPEVEAKILEEIMAETEKEVKNQVYLHGALCEALRLFPPIPFELKQAIKADVLPSGHEIEPKTSIVFSLYAMGRCEEIWGKNCLEFMPERWISEKGHIVYVPSYKFMSFNAGPRTCLGKDLAFMQMKMVATAILGNYHVQVVEDHPVSPNLSIMLLMKQGLKVRITRRG